MPQLTFPRSPSGWIVPALIGLDHAASVTVAAAGLNIPAPIRGSALIDSGSNVTCVSAHIIAQLPLIPRGSQSTQTVAGAATVRRFDVSLSIIPLTAQPASMFTIPDLLVAELPQALDDIEILIGLDVLDLCQTTMDGPNQTLTLSF